jgi:hypothetical protein
VISLNRRRGRPLLQFRSFLSPLRKAFILSGDVQHCSSGNRIAHQFGLDAGFLGAANAQDR